MSTEQVLVKKSKKTPSYDKVGHDVKKLLTATAATYIPELCNALRQDWYPRTSDETFARDANKGVRDEIRERILDDWSNQRNWLESPWGDATIGNWWPDWLRNPIAQEGTKVSRAAALAAKKYKQDLELQSSKIFSEKSISQLPEVPKQLEPKPERETKEEEEGPDEYIGDPVFESYGDNVKAPIALFGEINSAMTELFRTLTAKEYLPESDRIDLLIEYLKPSRDFRKGIFYEIDRDMRIACRNSMVYLRDTLNDTIKILDDIDKSEGRLNE